MPKKKLNKLLSKALNQESPENVLIGKALNYHASTFPYPQKAIKPIPTNFKKKRTN